MAVRQLSAIYLAGVSVFGVAILFAHHPALKVGTYQTAAFIGHTSYEGAVALNKHVLRPAGHYIGREVASLFEHKAEAPKMATAKAPQRVAAHVERKHPVVAQLTSHPKPVKPAPELRPSVLPEEHAQIADATPRVEPKLELPAPKLQLAPQATTPVSTPPPSNQTTAPTLPPLSGVEIARVTQRFRDSLTSEMFQNFQLFLYVSKASAGPWAQHMYVFEKQPSGDLKLLYNWAVSTGREKVELDPAGDKQPSFTPQGYYELDSKRMYVHHVSGQWQSPMPYAMFFNWETGGYQTGLAIHAATGGDISLLGQRASAGCVRLAPENARVLFSLIKSKYKGLMPKFAYDRRTATMANNGMMLHDADGHVQLTDGYKVLVFIEDYGGENVVAALF
ncbi:MAG TPA: L,D-transpeptidase family protein [Rhizomicrobium sp.]|nr:L,D-transpeptidase family protein [Rhizomicrobium sp.]